MTTSTRSRLIICGLLMISLAAWASPRSAAQNEQNASNQVVAMDQTPTFRVTVVGRTTEAVNYHFRSGSTKVDLKGTELMPDATGTAKVESHLGRIGLDVKVNHLESPQRFGTEYLTYVLWAITPEGRASNLGEFVPGDDDRKISVTTDLQAFGLVVTAEPYFGVTQPSNLVVMENLVRPDTVGASEYIEAKYELVGKGQYIPKRSAYAPLALDPKIPIYLHEARNAVRIAQLAGAEQYAAESFGKSATLLQQAEDYQARKKPEQKPIATVAREAVQAAEDARLITMRHREEEYTARERKDAADREAKAHNETAQATANADAQSEAARRAREEAERARAAQAKAEGDSAQARADAAAAAANADAEKNRMAAEAERLRLQSEGEKAQLRAQLLQQLNAVLATRDTARGLVINMSDVLFETAKSTLRPVARERLSKIAGIVVANPDLRLIAEGHTDNVGGEAYNQDLSERRAGSVRDYLAEQGVSMGSMTARGFGKDQPVATNGTAAGRQLNRRVELVVSGETIGGGAIVPSGGQN
jgi:outer membrane protein OmpA-like peptidoglycan-associated protein